MDKISQPVESILPKRRKTGPFKIYAVINLGVVIKVMARSRSDFFKNRSMGVCENVGYFYHSGKSRNVRWLWCDLKDQI